MPDGDLVGIGSEESLILEEGRFGTFQIKVRSGSSTFFVDEPFSAGGLGSGPNPYDLLSTAVGACSLMAMRLFATLNKWPLENIRIRVTYHRDSLLGPDLFIKELQLDGPLSEDQRQQITDISDHCPVQTMIARGSTVQTILLSSPLIDDIVVTRNIHVRDLRAAVFEMQRR
jgi:putative redox protein